MVLVLGSVTSPLLILSSLGGDECFAINGPTIPVDFHRGEILGDPLNRSHQSRSQIEVAANGGVMTEDDEAVDLDGFFHLVAFGLVFTIFTHTLL